MSFVLMYFTSNTTAVIQYWVARGGNYIDSGQKALTSTDALFKIALTCTVQALFGALDSF